MMDTKQQFYVGLDTHKEKIFATALTKDGEIFCSREFPNNKKAIETFFKGFSSVNTSIGIEACNFWRGPYKILRNLGFIVRLANPVKVSKFADEKKTDEVDSKIIADLDRTGFFPEIWIPSDEILELRDITRHKLSIMKERIRIQNKIKSYLCRDGIGYPKNLWKKSGIEWLKSLKNKEIDCLIRTFYFLKEEEKIAKDNVIKAGGKNEDIILLDTIKGVASYGAAIIYAEIGDINRFPTPKHLHAYAGLAPGIYQSGDKSRPQKRYQVNYNLKWIIGECSGRAIMIKSKLSKDYKRICEKKGWKIAKRVINRKLLTIIWFILKEKISYHE